MFAQDNSKLQKIIYERELKFNVLCEGKDNKIHDPKRLESFKIRKSTTSSNKGGLAQLTIEIYSENDPFFHYRTSIDKQDFDNIRSLNKLRIEFNEYPDYLITIFNKLGENGKSTGSFTLGLDGGGILELAQILPLKKDVIFYRHFVSQDLPVLRKKINADFYKLAGKTTEAEENLLNLIDTIKVKTPTVHQALIKLKVL